VIDVDDEDGNTEDGSTIKKRRSLRKWSNFQLNTTINELNGVSFATLDPRDTSIFHTCSGLLFFLRERPG